MTVATTKGAKGKADRLWSLVVRSRGACESCGNTHRPFHDAAHIIPRRYSATRTDPLNGWCACKTCHFRVDNYPDEKMALVEKTIGLAAYKELKARAEVPTKVDWHAEAARLSELWKAIEASVV